MGRQFVGILIKRERLKKNWSQEGLCAGICAVSYLSKIEQGKTDAGNDVVHLLLQRLGTSWHDDEATCGKTARLAGRMFEALFSSDYTALKTAEQEMDKHWETLSNCPYMLDFLLLRAVISNEGTADLKAFEACFDERQRTLWLLLQQKYDELLQYRPSAYVYLAAGSASYNDGNYPVALERLERSYDLAAGQGYVFIMLESRMLMGNCHSNTMEFERMQAHYQVAERLAAALGNENALYDIRYNTQATNLELGRVQESYRYFAELKRPTAMALHKLAICCEKMGKIEEAADALNRAETQTEDFPLKDLTWAMCELVRYRLEHRGYLKEDAYGRMLLSCFARIKKELPSGYANFHLPWVVEWYTASRQYKQAYELLLNFPSGKIINGI